MLKVNNDVLEEYEELTMDFILGDFNSLIGKGLLFSFDEGKSMRGLCAYKYFKAIIDEKGVLNSEHKVYSIIHKNSL